MTQDKQVPEDRVEARELLVARALARSHGLGDHMSDKHLKPWLRDARTAIASLSSTERPAAEVGRENEEIFDAADIPLSNSKGPLSLADRARLAVTPREIPSPSEPTGGCGQPAISEQNREAMARELLAAEYGEGQSTQEVRAAASPQPALTLRAEPCSASQPLRGFDQAQEDGE